MPRLLCRAVESFDVRGLGAVAVLEAAPDWRTPGTESLWNREAIRLLRPDGSSVRTFIKSLEFPRRSGGEAVAMVPPFDVPAAEVPAGTLVFLEREDAEPVYWDGNRAGYAAAPRAHPTPDAGMWPREDPAATSGE